MSPEQWEDAVDRAWKTYYTPEHIETVMRRARGRGISRRRDSLLWFYGCIAFEKVHPLDGGFLRRKGRRDRRPGLPREGRLRYYPRRVWETLSTQARVLALFMKFRRVRREIKNSPDVHTYTDVAMTPVEQPELATLDLFTQTSSAKAAASVSTRARISSP